MQPAEHFNRICADNLPGLLGIVTTHVGAGELKAEMQVTPSLLAPNGFLHAGSIVTLADTACGNGCISNLPDGAHSFTTIELKSNHLGTARDGNVKCVATLTHSGRTTQVWDAVVSHKQSGKTIALFRCTQMIMYPR
ncbi:MAG: PaaI family thioesterase [Spongiibacteraceae bacterium]